MQVWLIEEVKLKNRTKNIRKEKHVKQKKVKKPENTRKNNKPDIHFIIFFLEVDEVRHHC
jgi:hypothetical protein